MEALQAYEWPGNIRELENEVTRMVSLGDETIVPAVLPLMTKQALANQFGSSFVNETAVQPVGSWVGPIASRHGHHLVFIHQRVPASVPPLAEIEPKLRQHVLDKLADDWLEMRLQELRSACELALPEGVSNG